MWVAVETVDEDNVDQSPASGGIDLCEAVATDIWKAMGCLNKVRPSGERKSNTWQTKSGNLPSWPCKG